MNQLPLKSYVSMAFTRRAWPFWVIAVLLFLLWRSGASPAPSAVQHLPAPSPLRAVAGQYQQHPQETAYRPQHAPIWQEQEGNMRYRHDQPPPTTIWQASVIPLPQGPSYRPMPQLDTHYSDYRAQPPAMPYYLEREYPSASSPNWPSKPYMPQAGSSYHPPSRQAADQFSVPPPGYGYRTLGNSSSELPYDASSSWSSGYYSPPSPVGAIQEPRHPYAPVPVWQAQPSGSYYRSEGAYQRQPTPTWQPTSPTAFP